MHVLRLIVATLSAVLLADCGTMHACTADGVPCGEVSSLPPSGVARMSPPVLPAVPPTVVADAPLVPPVFEAPGPPAETPRPMPSAAVVETTPTVEDEPDSGRHHGHHSRHGGRHHGSGSGSHSRHHRTH